MISLILYCPTGKMLVPTMVKTDLGLFLERGPVEVAESTYTEACLTALINVRSRGVQTVPHPTVFVSATKTPSVRAAGAKSWTEFVRNAHLWHIDESKDGGLEICRWYSPPRKNHFEPDLEATISFPLGTPLQTVFVQAVALLQTAQRESC